MRGITVLALGVLALVACSSLQAGTSAGTSLRVSYWEDGSGGTPDAVWTLRCGPPGGSLARPARACKKLAAGGAKLFASFPPDTACTEIYGGPQRARVVGTVAGKRVWTTLTRTNGCEISRWARVSPWLLPPGGVT
jgi:hypothetical protein